MIKPSPPLSLSSSSGTLVGVQDQVNVMVGIKRRTIQDKEKTRITSFSWRFISRRKKRVTWGTSSASVRV
jgi:hypothetical protein